SPPPRSLHSFPTRRSSDLPAPPEPENGAPPGLQRFPPEKQPAPQPQAAPPAAHPAHAGSHHWLSREPANRQVSEQQGDDYVGDVGNAHEKREKAALNSPDLGLYVPPNFVMARKVYQ